LPKLLLLLLLLLLLMMMMMMVVGELVVGRGGEFGARARRCAQRRRKMAF
jgi:hypothetical protein